MKSGKASFLSLIGIFALLSRIAFISRPYFVDGPAHIRAITSGVNFIQPPGYFLFNETAWLLMHALGISPAAALISLNIAFSTAGSVIFALLVLRIFPGRLGMLLAVFYAFSDVMWFVADVHSSYASVTFFAPALLYALWFAESGWLAGVVWALMTGFRPSDGVFVLPFVAWMLYRKPRQIFSFLATALPLVAVWYLPTMKHFGGGLLSPLRSAGGQVDWQANGLFANDSRLRKLGNMVHVGTAAIDGWNILTVAAMLGLFVREKKRTDLAVYVFPGLLFYVFYFFSDPSYFSYILSPVVILAGLGLQRFRPALAHATVAVAILLSIAQMTLLHPIRYKNASQAALDAYVLEYSGWGLKHAYFLRMRIAEENLRRGMHISQNGVADPK